MVQDSFCKTLIGTSMFYVEPYDLQ